MIRRLNITDNFYPFQCKVLVVDDDYSHLLALDNTLTSFGYQVLVSENPEHAFAMIGLNGRSRIDIIVCGIPSSNIGAFNLIRAAKWEFNIPVILMVSDLSDKVTMREIMNGAAQCVLPKLPYSDLAVLKDLWQHVASTRTNDYHSSVYVPQIESTSRIVPSFNVVRETLTTHRRGLSFSSNPNTSLDKSHYHVPSTAYGGLNNLSNPNTSLDRSRYHVPTTAYGGGLNNCSNPNTSLDKSHYHVSDAAHRGVLNNCPNPNLDLKKREENSEGLDHDHDNDKVVNIKRRFNWTQEYHQIFVDGIEDINLKAKKVVPATILKYMHSRGVSHVHREHVASHLQKYRLNIKNHTDGSGDFANSDVVITNKQTIPITQNVQQETPPITQPSNEIDDWWDTLEHLPTGLENTSTSSILPDIFDEFIENNTIPTWQAHGNF